MFRQKFPTHDRLSLPSKANTAAVLALALCLLFVSGAAGFAATAHETDFVWAGDPEGGAPFVEADPKRPDELAGFDVEIADLIARGLGRKPIFININFSSIDQSVERGDAEIGLSGIEDTPARRANMAPTIPYYEFREVLSVRNADASRYKTLSDLRGRRVGTLGGTIAYDMLLGAEREFGIQAISYDDDVHPYSDLVIGRIDAVLLDNVLAERRRRTIPGFTIQPQSVALGHYVGVLSARNAQLRDSIDEVLRGAMGDGRLERIFRKWGVWNEEQQKLYQRILARETISPVSGFDGIGSVESASVWQLSRNYLPSLLRAAAITIVLSCLSMGLAVVLGVAIASGRVYGSRATRGV